MVLETADNLTAILYGIEDLRLEQTPIPKIADNEVLLEMDCVGICGSDIHYLVHGRAGDFIVKEPMIIGHEASGVIVKIGQNVKNVQVGDRVAIEPGIPCRLCEFCKTGRYNLCPEMKFCATPPVHGNLRRYYTHAADFCFKLPDHVTMEEGALIEPLSVGVHACRRAEIGLGVDVLILGAGPIGLATLLVAKAMGASSITITDLVEKRLLVAKSLGATHTYALPKGVPEDVLALEIHKLLGRAPHVTIDCSGCESTNKFAVYATKSGGTIVIVGCGPPEVKLPLVAAMARELNIRGVFRYCNDYETALSMVASGRIDVTQLITHHFDIQETAEAFKTSRYGLDDAIKVMIHCQPRNRNNQVKKLP